jgi:hypothetical protein
MGEGGAQFFDEGVVASLDASQAALYGCVVGGWFLHRRFRI